MTSAEAMAIAIEWADGSRTHRRPVVRDLADQARVYAAQADQDAAEVRKWTTLAVALAQIEKIRYRPQIEDIVDGCVGCGDLRDVMELRDGLCEQCRAPDPMARRDGAFYLDDGSLSGEAASEAL